MTRQQRIAGTVLIGLLFIIIQVYAAVRDANAPLSFKSTLFWVLYGSYAVISLLFYCIGSLVWLYTYGRQRIVATLLFCFTSVMMITFSTLSAGSVGSSFFSTLGDASSACSILFLFLLLLRFPHDLMADLNHISLRIITLGVMVLCGITVIRAIYVYLLHFSSFAWLDLLCLAYYALTGFAIIVIGAYSAIRAKAGRERQQMRLFFLGILISLGPILCLTFIPMLLHLPFVIDGTVSMVFLVLFPLTLSYTILRYDFLIFDSYIKKVATTLVSGLGLVLLTYILFTLGNILVSHNVSIALAILLLIGVFGAPLVYQMSCLFTERLFFPESRHYTDALDHSYTSQGEQTFDVFQVAHRLIVTVIETLQAPGACIFVLNEDTNIYYLLPPLASEKRIASMQALLIEQIRNTSILTQENAGQIAGTIPCIELLRTTSRPLFLHEVLVQNEERPAGLARYIARKAKIDPLVAPIYSPMQQLIGIVFVSARGDEQPYAGPELEALTHIIQRSAAAVETARQFQIATRQQVRIARELEEAYHQQRHLAELKEQLIIHMSHELRTPLTEVSGYLELLSQYRETLDPAAQELFLQKATHGCDELLNLLATILEAAKSTEQVKVSRLETVFLTPLLREEIEHLDPRSTEQHHIELQGEEAVAVWANEQFVRQVARNLLSNALKYSPGQTTITVSIHDNGKEVSMQVKDEGDGIPQDEMPQLFGKFVRLARHHAGSIRGTGLGLYLTKQMVETMDGHIWAESSGKEGEGATFCVQLPRAMPPTVPYGAASDMTVSVGFSMPVGPTEKMA